MLSAIHHLAIICSDKNKALHFYHDLLGFPVIRTNYRADRNDWKIDLRYIATITFRKQHYYLGRYERIEEAALARNKAEEVLYGEWLEHYENDLKAEYEAFYEERKKAIYEVLEQMRLYRGNEDEAFEGTSNAEGKDTFDETKD